MMLVAAVAGLLVAMALTLVRAFLGPRLYNRVLAINVFGTKTVLLISVLGVISAGRTSSTSRCSTRSSTSCPRSPCCG